MVKAKTQAIAFHLFWLFLLFLSFHFYQERTFADTAYFLFKVINEGFFQIQHGRAVIAISQVGALLGVTIGLSLQKVLIIHSVYNALFFYGIALWLFHTIKNTNAAWLYTLLLISSHWAYFSPYLEVFYGASFTVLFFAAFANSTHFSKYYLVYYPLLWLAVMAHPSFFLVVGAHIVFLYLEKRKLTPELKSIGLFFSAAVIVKILSFSVYEIGRLQSTSDPVKVNWVQAVVDLSQHYLTHYLSVLILLVAVVVIFVATKRWKLALFIGVSYLLFVGLVVFSLKNGAYKWYNEVTLLPFILVLILPLISTKFASKSSINNVLGAVLVLLFIWNITSIYDRGDLLGMRYQQMQTIASEAKDLYPDKSKFILDDTNYERSFTEAGMQLPYEFFIASAEFGASNAVAISLREMMKVDSSINLIQNQNQILYWGFSVGPISALNENYFNLQSSPYQSLHSAAYSGAIDQYIDQTQLSLVKHPIHAKGGSVIRPLINIEIQDLILPSSTSAAINLSYHIYSSEGDVVIWDGQRTPLEIDIKFNYQQRIEILLPENPGNYKVVIDLVKEGEKWFNKGVEYDLVVY